MTFTIDQIKRLSKWEDAFRTAVKSDYARGVTPRNAEEIFEILKSATGTNMILNSSCSRCIKDLLKLVGTRYFADKQEMAEIKEKDTKTKDESIGERKSRKTKNK